MANSGELEIRLIRAELALAAERKLRSRATGEFSKEGEDISEGRDRKLLALAEAEREFWRARADVFEQDAREVRKQLTESQARRDSMAKGLAHDRSIRSSRKAATVTAVVSSVAVVIAAFVAAFASWSR